MQLAKEAGGSTGEVPTFLKTHHEVAMVLWMMRGSLWVPRLKHLPKLCALWGRQLLQVLTKRNKVRSNVK